MASSHAQYTGLNTVTVAGVAVSGVRSYEVTENIPHLMDPSDDDVWPQGAVKGAGTVSWSMVTDDPVHGLDAGDTGNGGFTEKQGAGSAATACANQVVESLSRSGSSRGGRGQTTAAGRAYSADGSTSPMTWAT